MMNQRSHVRAGFTLIEVMIVVAIVGLLAVIAIPNFTVMQLRAKRSEAPLNLSAIGMAERAYKAEHGEFIGLSMEPRHILDLDGKAVPWPAEADLGQNVYHYFKGGWKVLGWTPDGLLYCCYYNNGVKLWAVCDLDNDDDITVYHQLDNGSVEFADPYYSSRY